MLLKQEQFQLWLEHKQLGTPDKQILNLLNVRETDILLLNNIYQLHGLETCKTIINSKSYPKLSDQYMLNVACRMLQDNLSYSMCAAIFLCSRIRCNTTIKLLNAAPNLLSSCTPEPYPKLLCSSFTLGRKTYHFDYDPDSQPSYPHPWLIYNTSDHADTTAPENKSSIEHDEKTTASSFVPKELDASVHADNTETTAPENKSSTEHDEKTTAPSFVKEELDASDHADTTAPENKSSTEHDEKTTAPSFVPEELAASVHADNTETAAPENKSSTEYDEKTTASSFVKEELAASDLADTTAPENKSSIGHDEKTTAPSFVKEELAASVHADNTDTTVSENKSSIGHNEQITAPSFVKEELAASDHADMTDSYSPSSTLEQAKELDDVPAYPVADCPLDELSMDDILDDMDMYDSDEPLVSFSPVPPIEDIKEDSVTNHEAKDQGSSSTQLPPEHQESANNTKQQEEALANEKDPIARANMKAALLMQQEIEDSTKAPKDSSFDYQKLHVFGIDALALNALLTNNIRQANPIALKELPQRFVILGGAKHNVLRAKNLAPYHVVALFKRDDPRFAQLCESQEQRTQQQLHTQNLK